MHSKAYLIAGIFCSAVFLTLLGIRLDIFTNHQTIVPIDPGALSSSDTWMGIFQDDQRIGYTHRQLRPLNSGYLQDETTHLRINTMGMVQDLTIRTRSELNPDLTLISFVFDLNSSLFHFTAEGNRTGDTLTIRVGGDSIEIPVDEPLYMTGGLSAALSTANLPPGRTRSFWIFDPATMATRPVRIISTGKEIIESFGQPVNTHKFITNFMGASQTIWFDEHGDVVQEQGLMGIMIRRVSREEALRSLPEGGGRDMTRIAAVPIRGKIDHPDELKRLTVKINGTGHLPDLDGDRQKYADGVLTIFLEPPNAPGIQGQKPAKRFLRSSPFIQSDHPTIRELAIDIVAPSDPPRKQIRQLVNWVYKNIDKQPVLSVPSAMETLKNMRGDCNEHAVLLAALARSIEIPARIEAGLVYMNGQFYYHAWNALWLNNRWISADAALGQFPADVTHIRLVQGSPERQLDLIGVIGKIDLEILEPKQ